MTVGSDRLNWPEDRKVNDSLKGTDGAPCDEVVLWCNRGVLQRDSSRVWQSKMQMCFLTRWIIIHCVLHWNGKEWGDSVNHYDNYQGPGGAVVVVVPSVKYGRLKKRHHIQSVHSWLMPNSCQPGIELDACAWWNSNACVRALHGQLRAAIVEGCARCYGQSGQTTCSRNVTQDHVT